MTNAYWCRDQNFRKYFEMRKKHGIEPSIDYKNYYNREKAQEFYQGLDRLNELVTDVKNVKVI